MPLHRNRAFSPALRALGIVDAGLLAPWSPLKRFAWICVIELAQPLPV